MKKFRIFLIALACVAFTQCQAASKADLSQGLPLPEIPDTLVLPEQRADYLVAHFWDALDFNDTKYALDTVFMESAFSSFASVMPVATQGAPMQDKIDALMSRAAVNAKSYRMLANVAEKYLNEIDSPVYNEALYRYFVDAQLAGKLIDDATRTRLEFQQQCLSLNLPGTPANDFEFIDRDGKKRKLSECFGDATKTLIIFYDPDCDDCHQLMEHLQGDQWVNNAIDHHWLTIMAIARSDTRDRWEETKDSLPQSWIVGCDITDVEGNDIYYLPNTPSLYVVDHQGNIVVKNLQPRPTLEALMNND